MHTASSQNTAKRMKIRFKSFSSGSCGNCYFVGVEKDGRTEGILIDAGVSPRRLKKELAAEKLDFDNFSAILVTHDHLDHIRSLGSYCKHVMKPVYASKALVGALSRHFITGESLLPCRRILEEGWNVITPDISVRYFELPHDATQTVGFAVLAAGHRYVHITDCGRMTQEALEWCRQADTLVLESNYDTDMLLNGPYPKELQDRIRNGYGHLSNRECAEALRAVAHPGLRYVFLCHLSEHNNTPQLALKSACEALSCWETVRVVPLPRQTASPMYEL